MPSTSSSVNAFQAFTVESIIDGFPKNITSTCMWGEQLLVGLQDGTLLFFQGQNPDLGQSKWQVVKTHRDVERKAILHMIAVTLPVASRPFPSTPAAGKLTSTTPQAAAQNVSSAPISVGSVSNTRPGSPDSSEPASMVGSYTEQASSLGRPSFNSDRQSGSQQPQQVPSSALPNAGVLGGGMVSGRPLLLSLTEDGVNVRSLPDGMLRYQASRSKGGTCMTWSASRCQLAVLVRRRVVVFQLKVREKPGGVQTSGVTLEEVADVAVPDASTTAILWAGDSLFLGAKKAYYLMTANKMPAYSYTATAPEAAGHSRRQSQSGSLQTAPSGTATATTTQPGGSSTAGAAVAAPSQQAVATQLTLQPGEVCGVGSQLAAPCMAVTCCAPGGSGGEEVEVLLVKDTTVMCCDVQGRQSRRVPITFDDVPQALVAGTHYVVAITSSGLEARSLRRGDNGLAVQKVSSITADAKLIATGLPGPDGSLVLGSSSGSGVARLVPVPLHQQAQSLAQLGLYEEALDVAGQLPEQDDTRVRLEGRLRLLYAHHLFSSSEWDEGMAQLALCSGTARHSMGGDNAATSDNQATTNSTTTATGAFTDSASYQSAITVLVLLRILPSLVPYKLRHLLPSATALAGTELPEVAEPKGDDFAVAASRALPYLTTCRSRTIAAHPELVEARTAWAKAIADGNADDRAAARGLSSDGSSSRKERSVSDATATSQLTQAVAAAAAATPSDCTITTTTPPPPPVQSSAVPDPLNLLVLVDTGTVAALLAQKEDTGTLLRFLQVAPHWVDLFEGRAMLRATGRYAELAALLKYHGRHEEALEVLHACSQDFDSLHPTPTGAAADLRGLPGVWAAVRYLTHLASAHVDLIRKHSEWILKADPEAGFQAFLQMRQPLEPSLALDILHKHSPAYAGMYLEAALQLGVAAPQDYHTELLLIYLQEILDREDETASDEDSNDEDASAPATPLTSDRPQHDHMPLLDAPGTGNIQLHQQGGMQQGSTPTLGTKSAPPGTLNYATSATNTGPTFVLGSNNTAANIPHVSSFSPLNQSAAAAGAKSHQQESKMLHRLTHGRRKARTGSSVPSVLSTAATPISPQEGAALHPRSASVSGHGDAPRLSMDSATTGTESTAAGSLGTPTTLGNLSAELSPVNASAAGGKESGSSDGKLSAISTAHKRKRTKVSTSRTRLGFSSLLDPMTSYATSATGPLPLFPDRPKAAAKPALQAPAHTHTGSDKGQPAAGDAAQEKPPSEMKERAAAGDAQSKRTGSSSPSPVATPPTSDEEDAEKSSGSRTSAVREPARKAGQRPPHEISNTQSAAAIAAAAGREVSGSAPVKGASGKGRAVGAAAASSSITDVEDAFDLQWAAAPFSAPGKSSGQVTTTDAELHSPKRLVGFAPKSKSSADLLKDHQSATAQADDENDERVQGDKRRGAHSGKSTPTKASSFIGAVAQGKLLGLLSRATAGLSQSSSKTNLADTEMQSHGAEPPARGTDKDLSGAGNGISMQPFKTGRSKLVQDNDAGAVVQTTVSAPPPPRMRRRPLYQRLRDLVFQSPYLDPQHVLSKVPPGELPEIRALMLERLGLHREALRQYCHVMRDMPSVEAYCDRIYNAEITTRGSIDGMPRRLSQTALQQGVVTEPVGAFSPPAEILLKPSDIYAMLLQVVLESATFQEESAHTIGASNSGHTSQKSANHDDVASAIDQTRTTRTSAPHIWQDLMWILARSVSRLDILQIMQDIPPNMPMSWIQPLSMSAISNATETKRKQTLTKNLRRAENLALKESAGTERSGRVLLTSDRTCCLCYKRLGLSVFLVYPDMSLAHYQCHKRHHPDQATHMLQPPPVQQVMMPLQPAMMHSPAVTALPTSSAASTDAPPLPTSMPAVGSNSDMNTRQHGSNGSSRFPVHGDNTLGFRAGTFATASGHAGSSHGVSVSKHVAITPGVIQRRGSANGAAHTHSHLRPHDAVQRPVGVHGSADMPANTTVGQDGIPGGHTVDHGPASTVANAVPSGAGALPALPALSVPAVPGGGRAGSDVYGAQGVKLAIPDSLLDS